MLTAIEERTFDRDVLKSDIPVLVSFWTPWCSICRWIEPVLHQLQSTHVLKIVSVNADENFRLARRYQLTNIPSLLLFDQGQLVYRIDHISNREDAHRLLHIALDSVASSQLSAG